MLVLLFGLLFADIVTVQKRHLKRNEHKKSSIIIITTSIDEGGPKH